MNKNNFKELRMTNLLMAGLLLAFGAVLAWPLLTGGGSWPSAAEGSKMDTKWATTHSAGNPPPIDTQQPKRFETATFAVG